MKATDIKIKDTGSYKIGLNEIEGLESALKEVMQPIQKLLQDKVYWSDLELQQVEYLRRAGFIPYSHNAGGLELSLHVPKCESHDFDYLEFGECDECNKVECGNQCGYKGEECGLESEGDLDAFMRIRLKFEGIQDDGSLQFYLFLEGGNNDTPYFRNLPTLFEAEFSCKSVAGFKRASSSHIKKLMKLLK